MIATAFFLVGRPSSSSTQPSFSTQPSLAEAVGASTQRPASRRSRSRSKLRREIVPVQLRPQTTLAALNTSPLDIDRGSSSPGWSIIPATIWILFVGTGTLYYNSTAFQNGATTANGATGSRRTRPDRGIEGRCASSRYYSSVQYTHSAA